MYNDDLFNWRLHTAMGNLSDAQASYIDLVASLAMGDVGYFHFAGREGCDHFDPAVMLDWVKESGLVDDANLHDGAYKALTAGRKPFMTKDEIEGRMKVADGHCPFCGTLCSFHDHKDPSGRFYQVMSHCHHLSINAADDPESALRRPSVWQGKRWPYSFAGLEALPDGTPLRDEPYISHHCMVCHRDTAIDKLRPKVVAALVDWYTQANREDWRGLGSSPVSALRCAFCDGTTASGGPCSHVMGQIERWANEILGNEHTELRLNGAGLKLYARGVHVGFGFTSDVTFSMRIGGDQASHYGPFIAYASERLTAAGIADFTTKRG